MDEEDNSKAAAVSSTANRLERRGRTARLVHPADTYSPRFPRGLRRRLPPPKGRSAAPPSRYRATTRLTGSTRRGGVIRTIGNSDNHRSMISNRQLAQNEERKSEHHACREDRSDLGKCGCTVSRSKFRCLIPPARTKNVHVGLHLATGSPAHSPGAGDAPPSKWEHRREEIIAPWANAPFAIVEQSPGRNFDQRRMRPTPQEVADITDGSPTRARRPRQTLFGHGCPNRTVAGVDRVGTLTTTIFDHSHARSALDHDVYGPPSCFCDALAGRAQSLRINKQ